MCPRHLLAVIGEAGCEIGGLLPYFPLANGALTGKYKRGAAMPEGARLTKLPQRADEIFSEDNWRRIEGLTAFAEQHGHTLVELAFSWLRR